MPMYEIWTEEFKIKNNFIPTVMHGKIAAPNFKTACDKFFRGNKLYDRITTTYFGRRLFDNQIDACMRWDDV
jgi:hypothetical protein